MRRRKCAHILRACIESLESRRMLTVWPIGTEQTANTTPTHPNFFSSFSPVIAMDAQGDIVVAWQTQQNLSANHQILAQRFNADGSPEGTEIVVGDPAQTAS